MSSDAPNPALRISMLTGIVAVLLLALVSRLWFLQVLAGERYDQLSERNAVQIVYTQAPRGRILAADGTPIVKNRVALTVSADRKRLLDGDGQPEDAAARAVLRRLSELLGMPVEEIVTTLTDPKYSPFRPVPIAVDVPPEVVLAVQEHQELFPGVIAERLPVRAYPHGRVAAHVLGYTAEISQDQLDRDEFDDYQLGDIVGKAGLEQSYEQQLQGERGRRVLEVNAQGTVLDELREQRPEPGNDVVVSLDLRLQRRVERLLDRGMRQARETVTDDDGEPAKVSSGAAVVLEVDTGRVLAMASNPTYDPRRFVGGVSTEYFNDVYRDVVVEPDGDDEDDEPEVTEDPDPQPKAGVNRAVEEAWPPGSTFKAITGSAFLASGVIGVDTRLECPPVWRLGQRSFRNWNSAHEGTMEITTALKRSCDTFFYEAASREWQRERGGDDQDGGRPAGMQRTARQFGLDEPLGIDLPGEVGGTIPDDSWKEAYYEANKDRWCALKDSRSQSAYQREILAENCESFHVWKGGDDVNMAIGQGFVATTPLQIANAYAAIANGGNLMRPQLGVEVRSPDGEVVETIEPEKLGELPLDGRELAAVRSGLEQVVMGDRGTAASAFSGFPLDRVSVAGKTGTAQAGDGTPFAWFVSYAPVENPEIAVVVVVEEGGGGSQTAAPIVRTIHEAYFGLEVTGFQPGQVTE